MLCQTNATHNNFDICDRAQPFNLQRQLHQQPPPPSSSSSSGLNPIMRKPSIEPLLADDDDADVGQPNQNIQSSSSFQQQQVDSANSLDDLAASVLSPFSPSSGTLEDLLNPQDSDPKIHVTPGGGDADDSMELLRLQDQAHHHQQQQKPLGHLVLTLPQSSIAPSLSRNPSIAKQDSTPSSSSLQFPFSSIPL